MLLALHINRVGLLSSVGVVITTAVKQVGFMLNIGRLINKN